MCEREDEGSEQGQLQIKLFARPARSCDAPKYLPPSLPPATFFLLPFSSLHTMAPAAPKKGLKRPAPDTTGPASKKKRPLDKREKPQEKKKRARPVVAAPAESDESDLEDGEGFEEVPMDTDGDEGESRERMDVDGKPAKDPNGMRHSSL